MAIATLAERGELSRAARSFLRTEAGSAVLLLGAAVLALICGRTCWGATRSSGTPTLIALGRHRRVRARPAALGQRRPDGAVLPQRRPGDLPRDALGELRGVRALAAPRLAAAIGGLVVPAAIYLLFNAGGAGAAAWGVPISTDTAALLGVLALVGPRCPDQLRVFLLALAIVDDIGAVLAIALFYTDEVDVRRAAARRGAVRRAAGAALRRTSGGRRCTSDRRGDVARRVAARACTRAWSAWRWGCWSTPTRRGATTSPACR